MIALLAKGLLCYFLLVGMALAGGQAAVELTGAGRAWKYGAIGAMALAAGIVVVTA